MKISDLENRLQLHAAIAISAVKVPFDIEKEEITISDNKKIFKRTFIIAAAIILVLGTTALAAYRYLSADEFADTLGDSKLAEYFREEGFTPETVTDGKYRATLLGIVSGKKLSRFQSEDNLGTSPDRTYIVTAIEKTDGSSMTLDDSGSIVVTPLIQGYRPWELNIVYMQGGYTADIIDGVLYRLTECDSIEYFADRQIYMAVADMTFINNRPFKYDKDTGLISENEEYDGTNILFELELDKTKADRQKAEEYLKEIGFETADDTLSKKTYEVQGEEISKNVKLVISD